jgi:hypothetical protein
VPGDPERGDVHLRAHGRRSRSHNPLGGHRELQRPEQDGGVEPDRCRRRHDRRAGEQDQADDLGHGEAGRIALRNDGTWTGGEPINYAYQWLRCGSDGGNCGAIHGATAKTIALGSDDVNKRIRVRVTATNSAGSAAAQSSATSAVEAAAGPGGAVDVNSLPDTERLSTDPVKFVPSVITSTAPFQLQVCVVA